MNTQMYSVPAHLREQFVAGDDFAKHLKQRGWTVAEIRPVYTDPQVIAQPWLRSPHGLMYTDRAFYHLFGNAPFRAILRLLLSTPLVTRATLLQVCPDEVVLEAMLTFLHEQHMLIERSPRLCERTNVGRN